MKIPPKFKKIYRLLVVLLAIYVIWSICFDVCNLGHKVDNEAIVPCLFYLPPLGFLAIGIVFFKIIQSVVFLRFIRKIRNWFRKK